MPTTTARRIAISTIACPRWLTQYSVRKIAAYSPPGALGGGVVSTVDGGLGSVMYNQAALSGGVALVTGPWKQGAVTCAPTSWDCTVASTSELAGSCPDARIAVRAPSLAAWLRVS